MSFDAPVRKLEKRHSQRIHSIERKQILWAGFWVALSAVLSALSIIVIPSGWNLLGFLGAFLLFAFAALGVWRFSEGPGYHIMSLATESRKIVRQGNVLAKEREAEPVKANAKKKKEPKKPPPQRQPKTPIGVVLARYPVPVWNSPDLGVHYNRETDADTSYIKLHSASQVSYDSTFRFDFENQFADAILDGILRNQHSIGVSLIVSLSFAIADQSAWPE